MKELIKQTKGRNDVELLGLFDNKVRNTGQKRDDMLQLARGKYLVFIDDDDRISDTYIADILHALYSNPNTDCVVFDCICTVNGGSGKLCKYGVEFEYGDILGGKEWRGKPAHTMVYRSEIAKRHRFSSMQHGEDVDWVRRACLDIRVQTRIDKVLYYYDAMYATTSETVSLPDDVILQNIEKIRHRF
jgi:glycosyltransferase involved in cell wall biosynthesis